MINLNKKGFTSPVLPFLMISMILIILIISNEFNDITKMVLDINILGNLPNWMNMIASMFGIFVLGFLLISLLGLIFGGFTNFIEKVFTFDNSEQNRFLNKSWIKLGLEYIGYSLTFILFISLCVIWYKLMLFLISIIVIPTIAGYIFISLLILGIFVALVEPMKNIE